MEKIRAFVGHSYAKPDNETVTRILAVLKGIAKVQPNFTWETAQEPEANLVDRKVLAHFDGKNLFIGICTAKERVIDGQRLSKTFFSSKLSGSAVDFQHKTSDWLIQEIGVAIGRDMKIILLAEKGIRRPGELQGNLEFLEFERSEPEACAPALLVMIANLSKSVPPEATSSVQATESSPSVSEPEPAQQRPPTTEDWKNPKPSWNEGDFQSAIFDAVFYRDEQAQERISHAYLASELGANEDARRIWLSSMEFWRIAMDRGGKISALKELAEKQPPISAVWADLARVYVRYDEHAKAIEAFHRAIEAETDIAERVRLLGQVSIQYRKADKQDKAMESMRMARALSDENDIDERTILAAERDFAKEIGDNNALVGTLERILEMDPDDAEDRFALAYRYSEMELNGLAAYHYSKIHQGDRSEIAWNNLGVSFNEIGLPSLSVYALQRSQKLGGTLAAANLAWRLMNAGFTTEAGEVLANAAKTDNHHKNVDDALSKLKGIPEREEKQKDEAFKKASRVSEFYRSFGRALARADISAIAGKWSGPDGELLVAQHGDQVAISGKYEDGGLGLLSSALMGSSGFGRQIKQVYEVEYRGAVHGRAILGTVTRRKEGEQPPTTSLLGSIDAAPEVLIWVADDGLAMNVLERRSNGDPRFYTLTRG